ncbi:MAG: alginate lyase family protein [Candidatus Competibacteraceae bacterium]|nr:alginate lyase family protein [Candidatus Competibacteraceae bacterium]
MPAITTYFHTLRHLRPIQFYGRIWFRLYRPRPDFRIAPPLRPITGSWKALPARTPNLLGPERCRFLNQERDIISPSVWNQANCDKLWLYNLHYFDDLNADTASKRTVWHRALIERWIAENPPGFGNGWEPYPLSLRIVNWIHWALAGNELEETWQHSLAVQVRYLSRRLEHHLLGNHLFVNAKALIAAGWYFSGSEADSWRQTGLNLLARELPEQILEDGGHFERSPMYHALILQDLLDLLNLAQAYPNIVPESTLTTWRQKAVLMCQWLYAMSHPDGEIALFNDAAFGIAPSPSQLKDYVARLGLPPSSVPSVGLLMPSGYARLEVGLAVLLLDVGEIGPDYLPGHAHADTLSFELSVYGQRVFVNSGTSTYGSSSERERQRSTAAHNTVSIDGQNSSEIWGSFRVARRAKPHSVEIEANADTQLVRATHNGYHWLPGRPEHQREWCLTPHSLTVRDHITGKFEEAIAYFHIHPAVKIHAASFRHGTLNLPSGQIISWRIEGGIATIDPTTYHPEFGLSQPNMTLAARSTGTTIILQLAWD